MRLVRVDADHESRCIRHADGRPPFQDGDGDLDEPRQTHCRDCGGDGGWAVPYEVDRTTGGLIEAWQPCAACNGDGWVIETPEPETEQQAAT